MTGPATPSPSVRERPLPLLAWEVGAALEGRKTQFRRVVRPAIDNQSRCAVITDTFSENWFGALFFEGPTPESRGVLDVRCPYGRPGDRLWVRETHAFDFDLPAWEFEQYDEVGDVVGADTAIYYRADTEQPPLVRWHNGEEHRPRWRPSIHMPRWASRLTLEVTEVRVERVQDITYEDIMAEGCPEFWPGEAEARRDPDGAARRTYMARCSWFPNLWESINARRGCGWERDPWVWAVSFRVLPAPAGEVAR